MRLAPTLLLVVLAALPGLGQSTHQIIGYEALEHRLGGLVPTGAGVHVGMVEAPSGGYAPDPNHVEFASVVFRLLSGGGGISGHATTVGRHYFGSTTSVAPGVVDVDCYEASGWLGNHFLNGIGSTPPLTAAFKVLNNSWIGGGIDPRQSLRKLDFAIQSQGLVVCSGVNNGAGPLDVPLLSHSFNGIAIGRSDGNHRSGGTLAGYDKAGRQKPELVAPASATSFSTPLVSGAAALLVETARTHPSLAGNPDAERAEVIKAVLMAGALHRPGWDNGAPQSGPTRGVTITPLDAVYGADQLEVDRSHWVLSGGERVAAGAPGLAVDEVHAGWSAVDLDSGTSRYFRFAAEAGKPHLSAIATWNRELTANFGQFTIPNVDLELWALDAQGLPVSLVGAGGLASFTSGNVVSQSPKDNVEHLYLRDLAPGDYLLEVRRSADALPTWTVAVAWELRCPEPVSYGSGKLTSSGRTPTLTARGFPSEAVDEFWIEVADAEPNKNGILFHGSGRRSKPFFGGTLLVKGPIQRTGLRTTDAAGALSVRVPIDAAMIGIQRNYQFWFRDPPHPDGTTVGLSNAVEVVFCP